MIIVFVSCYLFPYFSSSSSDDNDMTSWTNLRNRIKAASLLKLPQNSNTNCKHVLSDSIVGSKVGQGDISCLDLRSSRISNVSEENKDEYVISVTSVNHTSEETEKSNETVKYPNSPSKSELTCSCSKGYSACQEINSLESSPVDIKRTRMEQTDVHPESTKDFKDKTGRDLLPKHSSQVVTDSHCTCEDLLNLEVHEGPSQAVFAFKMESSPCDYSGEDNSKTGINLECTEITLVEEVESKSSKPLIEIIGESPCEGDEAPKLELPDPPVKITNKEILDLNEVMIDIDTCQLNNTKCELFEKSKESFKDVIKDQEKQVISVFCMICILPIKF